MVRIALIGLGLVGNALAERFLKAGHSLTGFDVVRERRADLESLGGTAVTSASAAIDNSDVCILSLPTSEIAESVLNETAGVLHGKTVIDTTTGEPQVMQNLAKQLERQGIAYLDATIVGSSKHVRGGTVQVLVGGDKTAFHAHQKLFDAFANQVFYLGDSGSGARMKLVVNLVLGLNRAVLAEGLTYASEMGVNPEAALEVLRAGIAYSRVMDTKGQKMLEQNFEVESRLSQHHKDVRLILESASRVGQELPLTAIHDQLLARAEQMGFGDADNSAILLAFQKPK